MASYNEMLVGTRTREGTPGPPLIEREGVKRFSFVCGPDRILVEEVVDAIKAHVKPDDMDYVVLTAGEAKDKEVWAALNQFPLLTEKTVDGKTFRVRRLVVVRDAEKLKNYEPLPEWLATGEMGLASSAAVAAVFVSNMTTWPKDWHPEVREKAVKNGRLIECGPLNEKDALAYVQARANIDMPNATYLLSRVGWDIEAASNCLRKMRYFKAEIDGKVIDRFTEKAPADDFIAELLSLKKANALEAIEGISDADFDRIVVFLETRLTNLAKLHKVTKTHTQMRDIITNSKLSVHIVKDLIHLTKLYDDEKIMNCVGVLAFVDDWHRRGAREGLLEVLVSRW